MLGRAVAFPEEGQCRGGAVRGGGEWDFDGGERD
uniref:Uncharacterized protein n=1 Tax=Arundo donax TaxID=35708 RepID=A0A0A9H4B2_ARUDO